MKTKRKTKILSLILAITVVTTMIMAVPIAGFAANGDTWATIKSNVDITLTDANYLGTSTPSAAGCYGPDASSLYVKVPSNENTYGNGGFKIKNQATRWIAIKVSGAATIEATVKHGGSNGVRTVYFAKNGTDSTLSADNSYANHNLNPGEVGVAQYKKTTPGEEEIYFRASGDLYLQKITVTYPEAFELDQDSIELVKPGAEAVEGSIGYKYEGDIAPTFEFQTTNPKITAEKNGEAAQGKGTLKVKADADVEIGAEATITVNATIESQKYTKTFNVKVVEPTKDVYVCGKQGVKTITLKDNATDGEKYNKTLTYQRDGSHGATTSLVDDSTHKGTGIFEKVPYGEYKVEVTVEEKYYESASQGNVTVDTNTDTSAADPLFTISPKNLKSGASDQETINYNAMKGVVTWDFTTQKGDPNEYIKIEKAYGNVYSDKEGVTLWVDAVDTSNNGKFNSCDRAADVQFRCNAEGQETYVAVPVTKNSVITVTSKNEDNSQFNVKETGFAEIQRSKGSTETTTTIKYTGTDNGVLKLYVETVEGKTEKQDIHLHKIQVATPPDAPTNITDDWTNNSGAAGTWATEQDGEYTLTYAQGFNGNKGFTYDLSDKVTGLPAGKTLATAEGKVRVSFDMYQDSNYLPGDNYFVDLSSKIPDRFHWNGDGNDYGEKYGRLAGHSNGTYINFLANKISSGQTETGADTGRVEVKDIRIFDKWVNVSMEIDLSDLSKFTAEYDTGRADPAATASNNRQTLTQKNVPVKSDKLYLNVQPDSSVNNSHDVSIKFKNIKAEYIEFGDGSSDSGRYSATGSPEEVLGVIRFFQGYLGAADEYGFVFIDEGGGIIATDKIKKEQVMTFDESTPGFSGDLKGITSEEINKSFVAEGYVKVGTDYYYSDPITATVGTTTITGVE